MFEQRDYRVYRDVDRRDVYKKVCDWWAHQGFYVGQRGPYQIWGESYHSRIGLKREFNLYLNEVDDGVAFDLYLNARISDSGLVGGGIAAIICLPVAVVGGAVSYKEYEDDARNLMHSFWHFLDNQTEREGTTPPAKSTPPPPPPPEVPVGGDSRPCKQCGALLPQEWKACPYCGTKAK